MSNLTSAQKILLADLHLTDGLRLDYGNKRCAGPALRRRGYITIRKLIEADGFVSRAYLTPAGKTPASNAHLEQAVA